ncbi:MAG: RagB/SusD family nutrient uptake outer membrane protein, partial [Bacteroidota bacterium]
MRNISNYFLCLCLLALFACSEDNLDLRPGSITEANFYQSETDFERGVIGVYAKMSDIYWFNSNDPMHGFWQLPGDDMTTTGGVSFEVFDNLNPTTGFVSRYYDQMYQMLNRANTVLEKLDEESEIYTTSGLKDHHRGEVTFLRGWVNFQLWNYYGTSPLITQRVRLEDVEDGGFANASANALLDQAIMDFQAAAGLLPDSWPSTDLGRVTSNSANGMLAKALVFRASATGQNADYTAAIAAADAITSRSLVANFGDNFNAQTENNEESLFEFQASQATSDNVWLSNDFSTGANGSMSAYWGYYDNHWSLFGKPRFQATGKFIAALEADDPRIPFTVDPETRNVLKYVVDNQFTDAGVGSANNPRILRLADVMLLKAEAIVQSGGSTDAALAIVNEIRARANAMVDSTDAPLPIAIGGQTAAEAMDIIRNERMIELFGEGGHRWLDLRRWHLGGQIDLAQWDFDSDRDDFNIELPKNLNYPIPLAEVDLNPNVT